MALNFGVGSGLFPTSDASGQGLRTKTELQMRREEQDTIPDIAPGEVILWERGDGQGENHKVDNGSVFPLELASRWSGQQFTIGTVSNKGDFIINTLTVKVFREGNPGTVDVDIFAVDGDGKPTGASLSNGSFNGNVLTTDSGGELKEVSMSAFTFNNETMYAWVMKADGSSNNNEVHIRYDSNAAAYTGGQRLASGDTGSTWSVNADQYYFDLQGGGKFLITRTTDNDLYQATLTKV